MLVSQAHMLPNWLKDNIKHICDYCQTPYQIGLSPNGMRVTKYYCPNTECPETIVMKMVFVWNLLGVQGIKEGNSRNLVKTHNLKHHLDAIPYVIQSKDKIKISIVDFMRIQCIQGIDDSWKSVCAEADSVDYVLNHSTTAKFVKEKDLDNIRSSTKYFEIFFPIKQEYEPVLYYNIMMTGNILDLPNRESFVDAMNYKYKGLLALSYSKSIRKTGVSFLVKEKESPITNKVTTAINYGIPIITPREFLVLVDTKIKEKVGNTF